MKTYAVLLGLVLQLATCTIVFGFLGHLAAQQWRHPWIMAVGVLLGLAVGSLGIGLLAKKMLGDKS